MEILYKVIGYALIVSYFVLFWKLSIWAQSLFLHRYGAHKQFSFTSELWERRAYVFTLIGLNSSYLSKYAYGIFHRMHHAFADTDKDPHRPYPGFFGVFKMMWTTAQRYSAVLNDQEYMMIDGQKVEIEDRFKKPEDVGFRWKKFDYIANLWIVRIFWGVLHLMVYILLDYYFELSPLIYVLFVLQIIVGPLHGAIVNYGAHIWGGRPHSMSNTSTNFPRWLRRLLGLSGELLHNNHHFDPTSPDFSLGENQDSGYKILLWLEKRGVITFNNV
jgi:stearoyl-CoA desaturase (delta-9 desaturase)